MSERPWCTCANAKNAPERDCPVHAEMYQTPAVQKYEQQMQAAFDAAASHQDCCCDT